MDLKKYLDSRNFQYKDFAEMIGISATALSNYMYKRREPRPYIRERIVKATQGSVTILDLLKK
jgi:transcriptional regulator with XRE-family HTH domain